MLSYKDVKILHCYPFRMSKSYIFILLGCQNLTLLPYEDVKILFCYSMRMLKSYLLRYEDVKI